MVEVCRKRVGGGDGFGGSGSALVEMIGRRIRAVVEMVGWWSMC